MRPARRSHIAGALIALYGALLSPSLARADEQRDPELKSLLQKIIASSDCFTDKYDAEVWYKAMEPRLVRFLPTHEARIEILDHVYCEAKRDPNMQLPPDLVLAMMDVESRFDRYAVSPVGAVGLMQVMPFWPRQLGVQNQLVKAAPNIRMGCEILRYYLRVENRNWTRALARYNGSVGRNTYPALVMQRWQHYWRF
ncbi:MAG TPA: lytic transglycosylase domain-containing protein [Steroidobacteraceae bacterium]|jgi:soluble lytic murein transglycosylase-like protein